MNDVTDMVPVFRLNNLHGIAIPTEQFEFSPKDDPALVVIHFPDFPKNLMGFRNLICQGNIFQFSHLIRLQIPKIAGAPRINNPLVILNDTSGS